MGISLRWVVLAYMDDFFDREIENREYADARVTDSQKSLRPGDFCKREHESGFVIYSEILDPVECSLDGRSEDDLDEYDREDLDFTKELYGQPHMANYRFTRSYSVCCPRGELGDIHIVGAIPISEKEFREALKELSA